MSNTKVSLQTSKLEKKQTDNEKKEVIVNIDEITIGNANAISSYKITEQQIEENNEHNGKKVINSVKSEAGNIAIVEEVDQQVPTVESVDKRRKVPDIWVQFQEVKGHNMRVGKQVEFGRLSEPGGRNYQNLPSGGGGGLDYDPQSRNGFLRIVFTILLAMLALTLLYNVLVLNSPSMTEFYRNHRRPLLFLSGGVLISMSYVMICCLPLVRAPPCNFIALLIVLAAMSNLVAVFTTMVETQIISFALIGTSVTVGVCLILALSKFDFTSWYLYLVVVMVVLSVLSVALAIGSLAMDINFKPLHMALLYIGTLVQVLVSFILS
ncbi:jg12466 [Pararge aegeria aegeria]|uniref:Jg12466 protein n=1 Tax=Pararge aegeria aegeria TaxID=348720 RepID=A0A8S4RT45_9NEOP|nr:jg12466 [Pararge aegeria aegeria]